MDQIQVAFLIRILSIYYLASSFSSGFNPVDNYLIDCGSPTNTSVADRVFLSDYAASKFLSTSQDVLATAANNLIVSSSDSPLYLTARIFTQTSRYTFPIRQHGRHWIRLYFSSSFVYENYDMSTASFSVFTENHVLLKDFRTCNATSFKEFSVNIASKNLEIMFAPSANSFAFLNAIEVVSVPDELITDDLVPIVGPLGQNFKGLSSQAFETVERVNMGGPMVFPENDTLWRTWVPEQPFLVHKNMVINVSNIEAVKYITGGKVTPNIAPASVYGTGTTIDYWYVFNITWQFEVDQGFCYLIRFHFCDIMNKKLHTLFFNVYVNSWIVASNMDASALSSNSLGTPFYMDYVTSPLLVTNKLSVSIGSSSFRDDRPDGILNGLEILKINNSMGNFDSQGMSSATKKKVGALAIGASIGGFLVVAIFVVLFLIVCKNEKRQALKGHSKTTANALDSLKYGTCIPFLVVQEATNNFDDGWIIGSGGFGKVYKGVLNDGTKVAVKRKNPGSQQGLAEFWTEIKMLSRFRHRNLVSLISYCDEGNEMILVYEYVENGTLRSHLHGSEVLPVLSWKQRLEICVDAAKGLHYLHTGFARAIIHRDVKSTNILLDENLKAKVADFGLSKIGPDIMKANHVSTAVKGSFGYLDPEYFRKQRLTLKSDVYSFGVVLFEVLCGRAAVDSTLPTEKIGLAGWALKWQKAGKIEEIIDPALVGEINLDSLKKFGEIAEKCLAEFGANRPMMGEVLQNLECALRLQEAAEKNISTNMMDGLPLQVDRKLQHSVSAFEIYEFSPTISSGSKKIMKSISQPTQSDDRWLLGTDKSYSLGFSV